jgi:glycine oxidase
MGKVKTDIAIIGQGLAGSLLAWELWQHGVNFRVFDPGSSNSASAAAGGLFYPLAARKIKEAELASEQFRVMKETFTVIEKELQIKFLFNILSLKLVKQEELPAWQLAAETGISHLVKEIHPDISMNGIKPGYAGAVIGNSGYVDVSGFVSVTREWLRGQNLLFSEMADYNKIVPGPGMVTINGHTEAKRLVFCEGPAGTENPFLPSGIIRKNKGELIEIEAPGVQEDFILRSDVFVLPVGNGRFRVGATYSHTDFDYHPTAEGLAELTEKLNRLIDLSYTVTGHWAGIRPTTRDRQPVIGSLPDQPGIAIFNGLGSRGVLQGPWYAALLRKWLTTSEIHWPKLVDINRFIK